MTDIDLSRVCELVAQGKSDRAVANEFQVNRHTARKLIEQAKIELARREQRGDADVVVLDPEPETIPEFVAAINKCLTKSLLGIIEAGRHLNNARIKHAGEFVRMVERDLDMSIRTANRFMAIAKDDRFWTYRSNLPTTWRTLYELTRLDDDEFERAIGSGAINPDMSQQDAIRLKNPAAVPPEGEERTHTMGCGPAAAAPPRSITDPAHAAPPEGEELSPADYPRGSSPAAAVPPHQDSVAEPAHPESNGDSGSDQAKQEGTADDQDSHGRHGPHLLSSALPNGHRAIAPSRSEPSDSLDFFPTPPWATRALIERVLPRLGIRHTDSTRITECWEPACGEGHMAEVLAEYISGVLASDAHDYGYDVDHTTTDFLNPNTTMDPPPDWIITNPPFGDKSVPFLLRALELAQIGVAIFVRSQWAVEGIGKYEHVYRDRPPTLFAPFMERVNLCKGRWDPDGTTATAYCWLVWVKNKAPKPPYWIPPGCRESLTRPDDAERFTAHPVKRKEPNPAPDAACGGEARSGNAEMESIGPPHSSSGEMPDIPAILDRRKQQTEQAK